MKIIITESQMRTIIEGSYKKYSVNTDVKLSEGGRTAKRISVNDFKKKMNDIWDKYLGNDKYAGKFSVDNFIYRFCTKYKGNNGYDALKKMTDDLSKVSFDSENLGSIGDVKKSGDLTYVACYGGGDWEIPVLFYVYWDGKDFRAYIPTYGNSFNRKAMRAIGNNDEEDIAFLRSQGFDGTDEELSDILNCHIKYDEKSCFKDFKSRVKIK